MGGGGSTDKMDCFLHDSGDDYCDSADKAKYDSQHSRARFGTGRLLFFSFQQVEA